MQRIWREAGLKPHLVKTFKISNDPQFEEKVTDVVGLYMNPPDKALVLCVDEKSQIQALDRIAAGPAPEAGPGRDDDARLQAPRHDDAVRRTRRAEAASSSANACPVIARRNSCASCAGSIGRRKDLDLHLMLDNYATHKTPEVKAWLAKHPRFHLHFTPTSASWLNLVERFFAEITTKRIRRGVFTSVADLEDAIHDYLDRHNADPKPFVWTKSARTILDKEARAKDKLDQIRLGVSE